MGNKEKHFIVLFIYFIFLSLEKKQKDSNAPFGSWKENGKGKGNDKKLSPFLSILIALLPFLHCSLRIQLRIRQSLVALNKNFTFFKSKKHQQRTKISLSFVFLNLHSNQTESKDENRVFIYREREKGEKETRIKGSNFEDDSSHCVQFHGTYFQGSLIQQ